MEFIVSSPQSSPVKLCLNMIVKNESRVILRLLQSVANVIDCYCICDTGSTDNTIELITDFFKEKGIPGKIPKEPFRDFGYNRSFALRECESMSDADYILLLDADMIFQLGDGLTPAEWKRGLTKPAYHMYQGTDSFYYKNARIVKNRIGASYWGVTHEYLKTPEGTEYGLIEKSRAFIRDVGDGGCKSDKFERDIRLLKKGLEDFPNNDRYTFYLANSYRDNGNHDLAIETYKQRIQLGGWFEEIWSSYYNIGKCYRTKGDMVNAIHWWMEGYEFFPHRIENLYEIVHYYRNANKPQLAYLYYNMALKRLILNPNPDYLFLQRDVYDYKLDYEFSIIGYYCNIDKFDMSRISMKVLNSKLADDTTLRNVLSNYKFYAKKLGDYRGSRISNEILETLANVGKDLIANEPDGADFVSSTPTITMVNRNLYGNPYDSDDSDDEPATYTMAVNVRYVNYRINEKGGYENKDNITTKNAMSTFRYSPTTGALEKVEADEWMWYDKTNDGLYVGLEDVRLFYLNQTDELLYNANRGLSAHNIAVECGKAMAVSKYDELAPRPPNGGLIYRNGGDKRQVEKNWVLFSDAADCMKMIYGWGVDGNLVIGSINAETMEFVETHKISTPPMFKFVRGSTNGVRIGDEIWFIGHMVSYEDRRYYYHLFITLDAETYEVRRYTPPFTFEGEKVEYTLGFVHIQSSGELLIGYSVMDKCTKFMCVPRMIIEGLM